MKILAFTDVHADKTMLEAIRLKSQDADLLICTGDIAWLGLGTEEVIKEFGSWNKPLLLIHGNHELVDDVQEESKKYENITFLHKNHTLINEIVFYGYGGDWYDPVSKEFEEWISKQKFPEAKKYVMLVHMPPHNVKQDYLPNYSAHRGNKSYRKHIDEFQPDLVLFGHFHEGFHVKDRVGKTILINPGPDGELFEL